jgi:hypothetical protein
LRQHLAVLKRQRPRPTLRATDRFFWIALRNLWARWSDVLLIVKPETVVALASRRIPPFLAVAIPPTRRTSEDYPRIAHPYPHDGE